MRRDDDRLSAAQAAYYEWQGRYHAADDADWQPARGDLAFLYYGDGFPGGEVISHVELVTSYDPATGAFETLSGNPVVERHTHARGDADVIGFADVDWSAPASA